MRTRVFVDRQQNQSVPLVWVTVPSTYAVNTTESFLALREYSWMVDVVTPKYHTLQNQGVIVNNPMWREMVDFRTGLTSLKVDGRNGKTRIHSEYSLVIPFGEVPPISQPDPASLEEFFTSEAQREMDLASNRAFANVELSEAAVLASLGELPETLSWFKSILTRGLNLTKLLRRKSNIIPQVLKLAIMEKPPTTVKKLAKSSARGNLKSSTDAVSNFANLWLEYRYAIRPLIFEMEQCLEALAAAIKKNSRQTARGKEVNVASTDDIKTHTHVQSSGDVVRTYRVISTTKLGCRAGVLFHIDEDINALLAVWGLDQPLQSAWELVPFSFIMDWFFSVGDVIGAYAPKASLSPLSSWCTCKYSYEAMIQPVSFTLSNKNGYVWDVPEVVHGSRTVKYQRTWRKPVAERSLLPSFDLKLNIAKIVDLGTIGRSMLFGKPKH